MKVVVSTHDRYAGAWKPFCHGFETYWPDRPWPLVFPTNRLKAPCGEILKMGGDRDWTANTKRILERIDDNVILLILEECWLTEPVDTAALLDFAAIVEHGDADHIRLVSSWKDHIYAKGPFLGDPRLLIFADDSDYRTSAQIGFWKVPVLYDLLRDGETIWDFERSNRSRGSNRFLCVAEHKYIRYVLNTKDRTYLSPYKSGPITKGKWSLAAKQYADKEGLTIDFTYDPDGGFGGRYFAC